jgi:hypothetical protein
VPCWSSTTPRSRRSWESVGNPAASASIGTSLSHQAGRTEKLASRRPTSLPDPDARSPDPPPPRPRDAAPAAAPRRAARHRPSSSSHLIAAHQPPATFGSRARRRRGKGQRQQRRGKPALGEAAGGALVAPGAALGAARGELGTPQFLDCGISQKEENGRAWFLAGTKIWGNVIATE